MDRIEEIKKSCFDELESCTTLFALQELKVKYLGKSGMLTTLLKSIKDLPAEERPTFGAKVNVLRNALEEGFERKSKLLAESEMRQRLEKERVDVSLLDVDTRGALHPITLVENQICQLLM